LFLNKYNIARLMPDDVICDSCKREIVFFTSPNGKNLFYCNNKFCVSYGKLL